ncbi:hypothetical protein [Endozoicomonas acroporae]|uniref:hypothetical protein n=1 Tax=Endozoicomonas acroporae TaxID=1701104 RepID=UPI0011AF63E8|nr:hypothetical protein [Endozoicomonas acroporae]
MNWQDYTSTPLWQQSDDAEKEHLRYRYWKDYLAPNIPVEHHREARTLFDQHTRRRGNPESNYAGDLWDALWHGGYAGAADLVSGASRLVGGDGHNAASDWFREKSEEQLDNMSPSSVEAMQGFGIERKAGGGYGLTDGSTAAGFGLQFASGLGSLAPSMIPGGVASKGLAALGAKGLQATGAAAGVKGLADARRVQGYANAIDKASHAIGYGATGGLMIGGAGAEDAKNAILSASYDQLKDSPRFQELYQQTYAAAGGGETRVPFEQAKALLAEEAAKEAFALAAGVGAVSMGIAGPIMEGLALGATGSRGANALKGLITEGAQEFGEGFGQQVAANYGQQQAGMDVGLTDRAMDQALTGLVVGGPVGGVVGGFGRTRNPEAVSILQNKLNDLMSQHQTLQDQMQEPHADQTMLAEQLRQNSLAIAGLKSQLRELGETIQEPEQPQPEAGAQPESEGGPQWYNWSDRNDPNNPPGGAGGGVSDNPNAGPQDVSDYDRPAWQRNRPGNPAEAVRFGQRHVDTAEPTSNLEQPSHWSGRSVGLEGQSPINTPMDTRNVGMPKQEVQQPAPQDNRWKNRTVTREKPQPAEPPQQSLPYYPPSDFTGNRYGTVDADPEMAKQDSQQRRAEQIDRAASQHPGSPEYTGNPDQDLASYTERMNSLNRLFRSFNWQRGDESKKRRVRKLIENQRRLEMKARKSGRGITPTSMKEALANLKAMVESGEGIRFEREVKAIEDRQQEEGLRLNAQQKSGTPSGIKPVMGKNGNLDSRT